MIDTKHYQIYNLRGDLVSVSDLTDINELRQLLCMEMKATEEFFEAAQEHNGNLLDAYDKWASKPRGIK